MPKHPAKSKRRRTRTTLADVRWKVFRNQAAFAKRLRKSQQTVSKYEKGVLLPPPDTRRHIATVLGCSVEELWPGLPAEERAS